MRNSINLRQLCEKSDKLLTGLNIEEEEKMTWTKSDNKKGKYGMIIL